MYICLCNKITNQDIEAANKDGYTYKCIFKELDVKVDCGTCIKHIKEILFIKSQNKSDIKNK